MFIIKVTVILLMSNCWRQESREMSGSNTFKTNNYTDKQIKLRRAQTRQIKKPKPKQTTICVANNVREPFCIRPYSDREK